MLGLEFVGRVRVPENPPSALVQHWQKCHLWRMDVTPMEAAETSLVMWKLEDAREKCFVIKH